MPSDTPRAPTPDTPLPPEARRIRSFVKRGGRTTSGQSKAYAQWGPRFLWPYQPTPFDWHAAFGERAARGQRILEIGFGMGEATALIAQTRPDDLFLACEVHEPGVGALLKRLGEAGLENVRICAHDAVEVLEHCLPRWSAQSPEQGLDGVHVFFPDPWHKSRHHKRRLIQGPLVAQLAQRLRPGGYLHCATDWEPYAEQMRDVLSADPLLANTSADPALGGYAPRPAYRPPTKFERRGLRLGHGVWDLVFTRRA